MSAPHNDPRMTDRHPPAAPGTIDRARGAVFEARRKDWRVGATTYHVMVDRFTQSLDIDAKRHLYAEPRRLMKWSEDPTRGERLEEHNINEQELQFWGGDLRSLRTGLDHIQRLGASVLYLNPIQDAFSNHKYDANDWGAISPEFGTHDDLIELIKDLDSRKMRLVLDGVFNHIGRRSPKFQAALANPGAPERAWFRFGDEHKHGYRAWHDAANLPEVDMDHPEVRRAVFDGPDSVIRKYLRAGVSGWRLDVAYDYGHAILEEITRAVHFEREDALVIGEIWNYPDGWHPSIDAIMNFYVRELTLNLLRSELPGHGPAMGRALGRMIEDLSATPGGYDYLLRSWLILDNHDTGRLATVIPDPRKRLIAQVLQFTLPGAPLVFYGGVAGLSGGHEPLCRGPMRWQRAKPVHEENDRLARIVQIRSQSEALRIGDFKVLDAEHCLAYSRTTDRWRDTVIVLINATDRDAREAVPHRDGKLMGHCPMVDALSGEDVRTEAGLVHVTVPAWSAMVLRPADTAGGYSPYKRIH